MIDARTDAMPVVSGVFHRWVPVNGIQIHVAEAGNHRDPPLLLLHGWPQHWLMWRHQIETLSKSYHVLCPDLRGFGWSESPRSGYDKEQLARDVVALLDALKIPEVRLVGHDWGGWVGFLVCLRHPERVERFLALNMTHPFQRPDGRVLSLWRFAYQLVLAAPFLGVWVQTRTPFVRKLLESAFVSPDQDAPKARQYSDRLRIRERARATVQLYRTFLLKEFLPILLGRYRKFRLRTPTLVLFGTQDFAISKSLLRGYEAHADSMQIEFVPQAGHFIVDDCPELVSERSLRFFGSSEASHGHSANGEEEQAAHADRNA